MSESVEIPEYDFNKKHNGSAGEMVAVLMVDIVNYIEEYQKTHNKRPHKVVDDAISELTEMLRGEEHSLKLLLNIILSVYQRLKTQVSVEHSIKENGQSDTLMVESVIKELHAGII